eukprot:951950-Prorocentrum_lima.AAC.1
MEMLHRWQAPAWVRHAVRALVCDRQVQSIIAGRLVAPRQLARGLGMGSPVSLLLWVLCFDPLIHALQCATGARAPTYVDDLA